MSATFDWPLLPKRRIHAVASATVVFLLATGQAAAQRGPTRVEYDVEFSTRGGIGQSGGTCRDTGTDMLKGTLVEVVPLTSLDAGEFVGHLSRTTSMNICGERMNRLNESFACNSAIVGGQYAYVRLSVEPGGQGGYLQFINDPQQRPRIPLPRPPTVQVRSVVTGSCDPVEMADLQLQYDQGSTGGSPDGQPLEMPSFPPSPSSYPKSYSPNPPQSVWTLTVFRRRP
jgi:hypothetical protein